MGNLIVIDGLDGSGKGTQAGLLRQTLLERGEDALKISFPDYDNPSSTLIKMYLSGAFGAHAGDVNAYAASSFYAVDRVASFLRYWKKDYELGRIIIADRYSTSNAIHQMAKLPKDRWDEYLAWMQDYEFKKLELPIPRLVLYLDMSPAVSAKLISTRYQGDESRKDLHERDLAYLLACRESAYYAADRLGWQIIQCSDEQSPYPVEQIHQTITNKVLEALNLL